MAPVQQVCAEVQQAVPQHVSPRARQAQVEASLEPPLLDPLPLLLVDPLLEVLDPLLLLEPLDPPLLPLPASAPPLLEPPLPLLLASAPPLPELLALPLLPDELPPLLVLPLPPPLELPLEDIPLLPVPLEPELLLVDAPPLAPCVESTPASTPRESAFWKGEPPQFVETAVAKIRATTTLAVGRTAHLSRSW
jgi:hypothetical protein